MKYTRVLFVLGPVVGIMAIGHLGWLAEVLDDAAGDSLGVECVNETSGLCGFDPPCMHATFPPAGEIRRIRYHKGMESRT